MDKNKINKLTFVGTTVKEGTRLSITVPAILRPYFPPGSFVQVRMFVKNKKGDN